MRPDEGIVGSHDVGPPHRRGPDAQNMAQLVLGHAYAVAGRKGDAEAVLKELSGAATKRYVPPYPVAAIYVGLGRFDEAFAWFERAYEGRDSWMAYLAIDPRMDVLRADPRYADLTRRLKLN